MKKLFFFLSFVFCLSFSMNAQASFLPATDAIDALKMAQTNLTTSSTAVDVDVASDLLLPSLKRSSIKGMIDVIKTSGNTEENFTQFFSQSYTTDGRMDAALLDETRDFIFSLITKVEEN